MIEPPKEETITSKLEGSQANHNATNIEITHHTDYKNADYDFILEVYKDIMMFGIVK